MMLIEMPFRTRSDIVLARQSAKRAAEGLGFAAQDQTRFATAVSEVIRELVAVSCSGRIEFNFEETRVPPLLIARMHASCVGEGQPALSAHSDPLIAARRLVDHFEFALLEKGATRIELGRRTMARDKTRPLAEIKSSLEQLRVPGADLNAAFTDQSRELIASLQELQDKQQELLRLNQELQDTNRGVVALYAELEEKAEQLRAASEAKSKFLANVSHEFRTPLNSILALSRLLLDRVDGGLESEQEKQVTFIRRSAETLLEFVNDLLDLAKVEAGKVELHPSEFQLVDFMRGLRGVLKPLRINDPVDLVFEECESIALIGDEGKLGQILRNLISNALKFTERGEVRVQVTYDRSRGTACFEVCDTGIGISAADQLRIFEEFEQIAGSLQKRNKGSGLGLALSQRLARLMGGEILLESELGRGSTFRLRVPLEAAEVAQRDGSGRTTRVLVVDDEETFRYVVRHILASESRYELIEAQDGAEGVARVRRDLPDVVIADLQMPVMTGQEMLRELAADPRTRDIPVIVSTSLPITATLLGELRAASKVLSKTELSRDTLLNAIRDSVGARTSSDHADQSLNSG
jgi:signal transduction histidine kinase/ActR/RegA family two-component response regulator